MITVRQVSALSGFSYEAVDGSGARVGSIEFPWVAQAGNARLRWHAPGSSAGDVRIEAAGQVHHVRHEYLNRRSHPDVRHSLRQAEQVLAVADVLPQPGWQRTVVQLRLPFSGRFSPYGSWLRRGWRVHDGVRCIGSVDPAAALMLRQAWVLRLPADMGLPLQLFMAFLARQMH